MLKSTKNWRQWFEKNHYHEHANLPAHDIACPCCGEHVSLPAMTQADKVDCPRCGYDLVHIERNPLKLPISYAVSILFLLVWIALGTYMSVTVIGPAEVSSLPDMIHNLWVKDFKTVSVAMFLMIFGVPFMFAILNIKIFGALLTRKETPLLQTATRICMKMHPWMMLDVFFIASIVALVKIQAMASISFHSAFVFVFMIMLIIVRLMLHMPKHWAYAKLAALTEPKVLNKKCTQTISCIECYFYQPKENRRCDICNSRLHHRKPSSLQLAFALVIAAMILYIPANVLPIMITSSVLTSTLASNIYDGIVLMWQDSDYFVAIIIFTASIFVPMAKIISMLILLFSAHFKMLASAKHLSKLYHIVEFVGRWSMIDVFVSVILMSSFATPMALVMPGPALMFFLAVVILTILSADCFDTRLLWDKEAAEQAQKQKKHSLEPIQ